jgi:hypothetical protein
LEIDDFAIDTVSTNVFLVIRLIVTAFVMMYLNYSTMHHYVEPIMMMLVFVIGFETNDKIQQRNALFAATEQLQSKIQTNDCKSCTSTFAAKIHRLINSSD